MGAYSHIVTDEEIVGFLKNNVDWDYLREQADLVDKLSDGAAKAGDMDEADLLTGLVWFLEDLLDWTTNREVERES